MAVYVVDTVPQPNLHTDISVTIFVADFYAVQKGVGQSDTPATWLNLMRVQRLSSQNEGR